jgi:hypothetical protein
VGNGITSPLNHRSRTTTFMFECHENHPLLNIIVTFISTNDHLQYLFNYIKMFLNDKISKDIFLECVASNSVGASTNFSQDFTQNEGKPGNALLAKYC